MIAHAQLAKELPPFLSVEDVAELAGVSRATAWRDVKEWNEGRLGLPVVHPGGRRRTRVERDVAVAYARGERFTDGRR